ncbi:hypothetical protein CS8_040510 [Cupriavidus sp. 8B]
MDTEHGHPHGTLKLARFRRPLATPGSNYKKQAPQAGYFPCGACFFVVPREQRRNLPRDAAGVAGGHCDRVSYSQYTTM